MYCIYISCCAGLPNWECEVGCGVWGVAEIAKIFCARHTEMRKIHFWPLAMGASWRCCRLLLPLLLQFLCSNIICIQQIRLTAAVTVSIACICICNCICSLYLYLLLLPDILTNLCKAGKGQWGRQLTFVIHNSQLVIRLCNIHAHLRITFYALCLRIYEAYA